MNRKVQWEQTPPDFSDYNPECLQKRGVLHQGFSPAPAMVGQEGSRPGAKVEKGQGGAAHVHTPTSTHKRVAKQATPEVEPSGQALKEMKLKL